MARELTAEFIGTFTLILIGAGAGAIGVGGLVGVALAHGLVVMAFAYAHGHISGSHINPAVTAGVWAAGKIDTGKAISYMVFQLLGGVVGALVLRWVLGGTESGLGLTQLSDGTSVSAGLVLEAILTFFLAYVVLQTAVGGKGGNQAGIAIGFTLVFCILMGGPLTGASLNPARSLGPAVAMGDFNLLWLYFAGPILGGVVAGFLYRQVMSKG